MTPVQQEALTRIAQCSVYVEQTAGLPALVTCAQCVLETGYLAHAPENNCFGIKSYAGEFGRQLLSTDEYFTAAELTQFLAKGDGRTAEPAAPVALDGARQKYFVMDWFATFATLENCFAYRSNLLLGSPIYREALDAYRGTQDADSFVDGIAPHYATSPDYAVEIKQLMAEPAVIQAVELARQTNQS
jgi:flagellum-specific peptidoglycan hydrolase FlgJ